MPQTPSSRRSVIRNAAGLGLTGIALIRQAHRLSWHTSDAAKSLEANDQIRVGTIGSGIMGSNNLEYTSRIPGVRIVARCDHYSRRSTLMSNHPRRVPSPGAPPKVTAQTSNTIRNGTYDGMRIGTAIEDDAWFGFRAAGRALLADMSLFEERIIYGYPLP